MRHSERMQVQRQLQVHLPPWFSTWRSQSTGGDSQVGLCQPYITLQAAYPAAPWEERISKRRAVVVQAAWGVAWLVA